MLEMIVAGCGIYSVYKYIKLKPLRKRNEEFQKILLEKGIKNKSGNTFWIYSYDITNYGWSCSVNCVEGLEFSKLLDCKETLQENFNCQVEFTETKTHDKMYIKFINKINEKEFSPIKTKPYELFIGYTLTGMPYKLDCTIDPHLIIAGTTGTGKSFLLGSILTNLIYNNSKDINIYLLQTVKRENDIYKNCKGVFNTYNNYEECCFILDKLSQKIDNVSEKFSQKGIRSIKQWNSKYTRKLKYNYVVLEEMSFFNVNEADNDDLKKLKKQCLQSLLKIAKAGRSVGIYLIGILQRTTATNLNTDLKSQMTRLTFKQKSSIDSKVILDNSDAKDLKPQEVILDSNTDYIKLKTPIIDEDFKVLNKYVPQIIISGTETNIKVKQSNIKYSSHNNIADKSCHIKSQQFTLEEYNKIERKKKIEQQTKEEINKRKSKLKTSKLSNTSVIDLEELKEQIKEKCL